MMKISDVKSATALIIQGYLRANEHSEGVPKLESSALIDCLTAIARECDDWAEGLESAIPSEAISVYFNGPRTPFNLRSAIEALKQELEDLDGPQDREWPNLGARV